MKKIFNCFFAYMVLSCMAGLNANAEDAVSSGVELQGSENVLNVEKEGNAGQETVIFGAAANASGGETEALVEQNGENVLGNPIPEAVLPERSEPADVNQADKTTPETKAPTPKKPAPLPEGDFQNTLMEANGMVYDVQAYPESDLPVIGNPSNPQTIYSPNVNH